MIGVSRTSLMVGGFRSKVLFVLSEEETDPSAVVSIVVVASGSMHEKKKHKQKQGEEIYSSNQIYNSCVNIIKYMTSGFPCT